jgi:hypothetical protein
LVDYVCKTLIPEVGEIVSVGEGWMIDIGVDDLDERMKMIGTGHSYGYCCFPGLIAL